MNISEKNTLSLENDLNWFARVLETRISLYFEQDCAFHSIYEIEAPDLEKDESEYAAVIKSCALDFDARLVLVLALIPHLRPQALDTFFTQNKNFDRGFTEFGGWKGKTHGGFMPTCETAAFIVAGVDLQKRLAVHALFQKDHVFAIQGILEVVHEGSGEPFFSGAIKISTEYLNRFTSGLTQRPDYSVHFPAKRITTKLSWDDVILTQAVLEEIDNIKTWLRHSKTILETWGMEKVIKPGYRALFYGPPGTGKTLTATLLGAAAEVDVYRIDLSMVVSKYIGETEKNLANVFDQAQNKNWILFFDEADALFGKRTQTSSSNDRYANQEISYLLQRVEDFPGVVILATNLSANIDEAFSRRFQSAIYFPLPDADQRLRLWKSVLNGKCRVASDVRLQVLAEQYEISAAAITNVACYGVIRALQNKETSIRQRDLLKGIARELMKEGKTV